MRIVITGAAGHLGRLLVEELGHDHDLVLLGRHRPLRAAPWRGVGRLPRAVRSRLFAAPSRWPFHEVDVLDGERLTTIFLGADAVVHLAGVYYPEDDRATFKINALGTVSVLGAARDAGISRVIHASSVNAFGTVWREPVNSPASYTSMPLEEDFPPYPVNTYSLAKWCAEQACAMTSRATGMRTASLRIGFVWDAAKYEATRAAGLFPAEAWSDCLFHWVHELDVIRAIRQAVEAQDLPVSGVYSICAADTITSTPTMELLRQFRPELSANATRPLDGRSSLISIERAAKAFSYDPKFRLAD